MLIPLLLPILIALTSALLHVEKAINLAAEVPEKLQAGNGCQCYCPKEKALAYVAEIDEVLTTYIQMAQYDLMTGLVAPTATYTIVKPGRCTGCYKFSGELEPEVLWGCIDCYKWHPIETTYYKNGVIVVRGIETVKKGKHTVFKGEVSRYYSADFGCAYKLELVIGSDERCTCCHEVGCDPVVPACVMISSIDDLDV